MAETINKGWLKDTSDIKFAPKTLVEQVQDSDGKLLSVYLDELNTVEVSPVEPTNETTQLWINPNVNETASLPEIKDNVINNDDTWSSAKINSMLSKMASCELNMGNNAFNSLEELVIATATDITKSHIFRFKDMTDFVPFNGSWFRCIAMYQNPYVSGNQYPIGGTLIMAGDDYNALYFCYISGNKDTGITAIWKELAFKNQLVKTVDVSVMLKDLTWTKSNDGMCYAAINASTYGSKVISATICGWGSLTPSYTVLPYITVPNKVSLMCPVNSFSQYANVTVRIVYVD